MTLWAISLSMTAVDDRKGHPYYTCMTLWAISLNIDSVNFAFGERSFSTYDTLSVA